MGKHLKNGRSKSGPPFVQLPWFMLDSLAWQSLTPQEVVLYLAVSRLYNGGNNGTLALSARDAAERCNISKNTVTKAFASLVDKGFLEIATQGGFSRKTRHASEWRLTAWQCNRTGALPSKGFMKWRPETAIEGKTRSQMRDTRSPDMGHSNPEQTENTPHGPKRGHRQSQNQPVTVPNEGTHIHSTMVGVSRIVGVAGRGAEPSNSAATRPASVTTASVERLICLPEKNGPRRSSDTALARSLETLERAVANG